MITPITITDTVDGEPTSPPPTSPPPPPAFAQANCYVTSSNSNQSVVRTYNGVHVMAGYYGTVDFKVSTYTGILELRGGNIAQNDAFYATAGGGHLAVTVHLDWTGGTLNSGPTAGWVHLEGATGIIDPGDGKTVGLGSQFQVNGGADVTQRGGTVQFLTDIGLDIINGTFLCQAKPERPEIAIKAAGNVLQAKNRIEIFQGGEFKLVNPSVNDPTFDLNAAKSFKIPVKVTNGKLTIGDKVTVSFEGVAQDQDGSLACSIYQTAGTISLAHGSILWGFHGLKLFGGQLITTTAITDASVVVLPAKIKGDLVVRETNIVILSGRNDGVIGDLYCDGKVYWFSGTYTPVVDAGYDASKPEGQRESPRASRWYATGEFTVATDTAKIDARFLNFSAALMRDGRLWNPILGSATKVTRVLFVDGPGPIPEASKTVEGKSYTIEVDTKPNSTDVVAWQLKWKQPS